MKKKMTNDEARMTKECLMTKSEAGRVLFDHLSLVILSSLGFRDSSLISGGIA